LAGLDIRALRRRLRLTQAAFAARYHLSRRVVANWECGRDTPSGSSTTLLTLIERAPDDIARILAWPQ